MLIPSLPLQNAMTRYVVSVAGPQPAWVRWDKNTGSPCFTFDRPDGLGRADAEVLKARADIGCGGTLTIVEVED